jgi:hypothetical protein
MIRLFKRGVTCGRLQDIAEDLREWENSAEEEVEYGDSGRQQQTAPDGDVEILLGDLCEDLRQTKSHI